MISNRGIIGPSIRGSYQGQARYFPRALMLHLPSTQSLRQNRADFDAYAAMEYHALNLHETAHWIQHHATGVGAFISSLQLAQEQTFLTWLLSLDGSRRDEVRRRRIERGLPIIAVDEFGLPNINQLTAYPNGIYLNIWSDMQWVSQIFEDCLGIEDVGTPPRNTIGEVMGDVLYYLHIMLDYPEPPDIPVARGLLNDEKAIQLIGNDDGRLTCTSLMECAATLDELSALTTIPFDKIVGMRHTDALRERLEKIWRTRYGYPLRLASTCVDVPTRDMLAWFRTVKLLCFLALDAPLPPLSLHLHDALRPRSWHELYPPARYMYLCRSVPFVGLVSTAATGEELCAYADKVCRIAGLQWCGCGNIDGLAGKRKAFAGMVENRGWVSGFQYYEYVAWVQAELFRLRRDSLDFLADHASAFVGEGVRKYAGLLLPTDDVPFCRAPILWHGGPKTGFSTDPEFGAILMQSIAAHYSLFDYVVGEGHVDLSVFPPDFADNGEYKKGIERSFLEFPASSETGHAFEGRRGAPSNEEG